MANTTKLPASFGKIKAARLVAAGEAAVVYKAEHPELGRDYYFKSPEAASKKLDSFCEEYGLDRTVGTTPTYLHIRRHVKEYVADKSGCCRPTMAWVMRSAFRPII